jgi:hypothetical protein
MFPNTYHVETIVKLKKIIWKGNKIKRYISITLYILNIFNFFL